jgi:hypothetical protein
MKATMRLLLALLLLLPAAASAQTPEADVQRTLERARQAGIPVELLESKIAEGRAKGVPMDRIAVAVERRFAVLLRVRTSIDPHRLFSSEELRVAGDALAAGVEEDVLKTVSARAPRERRAVAIAALSQLVSLGHPSEEALLRVTQALNGGPQALMNLHAQAAAAAARRGPPPGRGPPAGASGRRNPPDNPGSSGN